MKTKIEIIDETVAWYSEDTSRRATRGHKCVYYDVDSGNMCAIGRCMINAELASDVDMPATQLLLDKFPLKEEYRGHEELFWVNLQEIHDESENWNEEGLTEWGKLQVSALKTRYNENTSIPNNQD